MKFYLGEHHQGYYGLFAIELGLLYDADILLSLPFFVAGITLDSFQDSYHSGTGNIEDIEEIYVG